MTATKKSKRQKPPAKFNENPHLTAVQLRRMRPASEVVPAIVAASKRRGRPTVDAPKVLLSLRVDPNVVKIFKATGKGWQGKMNDALAYGATVLDRLPVLNIKVE